MTMNSCKIGFFAWHKRFFCLVSLAFGGQSSTPHRAIQQGRTLLLPLSTTENSPHE